MDRANRKTPNQKILLRAPFQLHGEIKVSASLLDYAHIGRQRGFECDRQIMTTEPTQLGRGKAFHKKMQADWLKTAQGIVSKEKAITKPSGRKGRIDIFVDDDGDNLVAVAEVKNSNWDKMTNSAVRRNVKRQIKQICDYIESQLTIKKDVSPGIIFPKRPEDREKMKLIERLFEEEGIPVVWQDETIEERKARASNIKK